MDIPTNYEKWKQLFSQHNLYAFNNHPDAILWLKVRSICRSRQLDKFLKENHINIEARTLQQKNKELYLLLETDIPHSQAILDKFLGDETNEWYVSLGVDVERLKADLFKVTNYSWGGDRNNSLDRALISRFVKPLAQFDELTKKRAQIANEAWSYVETSWYNNWTSFLIERLFKKNPRVVSAVGEIKSVDFFISNYPLDLKVTYFPRQFMEEKIKQRLGMSTLSWLKALAKKAEIKIDDPHVLTNEQLAAALTEILSASTHAEKLKELTSLRQEIIRKASQDKTEILRWLYANQGEMRFGAENRIFLILVDSLNPEDGWKMKRNFHVMEPVVNAYLENFTASTLKKIEFTYKDGRTYEALADAIFITK